MSLKSNDKNKWNAYLSPWIILGAVGILVTIVLVLAERNSSREKRHMSQTLLEKGAALIRSFEAAARTGMGMRWRGEQLQVLLEEMSRQPDILYLVVTDESGRILAASDNDRLGQSFVDEDRLRDLAPEAKSKWNTNVFGARQAFQVYRYFQPLPDRPWRGAGRGAVRGLPAGEGCDGPDAADDKADGPRAHGCPVWGPTPSAASSRQIIFVGFDATPFEDALAEDLRTTAVLSAVLLLLGLGGVVSLFWAQSSKTSRRLLQDASAFSAQVVASLPVGLIATDAAGRVAFFNQAAEAITGLDARQAVGQPRERVLPEGWRETSDGLADGRAIVERETEGTFPGGKTAPLSLSAARIRNEDGGLVGDIFILRDLREVRRLQEEIRRKDKLAALGGLAAGVAHEIRNPLGSIKGFATYFAGKFAEGSEDREAAQVMIQETERLNRVVGELLEFARPSDVTLAPADARKVLANSLRLIEPDARARGVRLELQADDLPPVRLDADRLTQALLNLYLNGVQAMEAGGTLTVRARRDGRRLRIEVADTGRGIREEDLGRIFNPYFTTKPAGTGLGLTIVHKIVEAHGGEVAAASQPGAGATVTLTLPLGADQEKSA